MTRKIRRNRGKGDRHKLRNLKHKGKHKIGCDPQSLIIFTAYKVQGWWTNILIPVKAQPYGSNTKEIILKISWHINLKNSKPYTYILQKLKNPPDGFCTHQLFASTIILIFGGLFFHRISRILKIGTENWVLSEAMSRKLEGVHVGFLRQITGQRAVQQEDGTWRQVASEKVLEKEGNQSLRTYIDKRQATVAEWVALRLILKVFYRETGYEVGGRLR